MRKVVISGKDSYIGKHIKDWLQASGEYLVEELDVQAEVWREYDFAGTEIVVHVAGIVHRPDIKEWSIYEKVNVQLPIKIAQRAKKQGVKQFVFISTMAVYGQMKKLKKNVIYADTPIRPIDMYGHSKFLAEEELRNIEDGDFKVTIVRPPNVYGKGCKGNYINRFVSVVKKLPVIPSAYCDIKQSMIYIDNLSNFIKVLIEDEAAGIYMPQDEEIVNTVELLETISHSLGRPLKRSKFAGGIVMALQWMPIVKKAYGGIEYDFEISKYNNKKYAVISFEEAIKETVGEG